jgi:hypothetical protein
MGEKPAATAMASDDATGRDMDALEPGRISLSLSLSLSLSFAISESC